MTRRYVLDPTQLTAEACKRRAVAKMADAANSTLTRELARDIVAEAQVWATLATVPEPLEEIHGQLLESTAGPVIPIPKLMCPHGMEAKVISNVDDPDSARYTWSRDCTQGCP